jgi:integrase
MACVLLGGQRPTQLLRLTSQDVDLSGGTVTLLDIKGRNRHANPRRHVLPIPDDLRPIIERRKASCETPDESIFGLTRKETVNALVTVVGAAMVAAKELERGPFSLRDLRRTAETHLAAMGVSSDTRAQLQSHGLGGIQARHYDKHDYMAEKRAALALWAARLTAAPVPAAVVVPIKRRARAAA